MRLLPRHTRRRRGESRNSDSGEPAYDFLTVKTFVSACVDVGVYGEFVDRGIHTSTKKFSKLSGTVSA